MIRFRIGWRRWARDFSRRQMQRMNKDTTPNPPSSGAPETLREYLAGSDATCPSCRYSLRGCETTTCPECGWGLQLQLKPRLATVPHWLFGLMIFGWLTIMGVGGTVAQADRFWNYYRSTSVRWVRQNNRAQSQAMIQQFLTQQPAVGSGSTSLLPPTGTGALAAPVVPPMPTFSESVYTYFVAMTLRDQMAVIVFFSAAVVGLCGLALIPLSRRCSPRFNTIFVMSGSVVFAALAMNYLYTYLLIWSRRF